MKQIKAVGSEIFGLFVEDARLSVALAIWIAVGAMTKIWWQSAPRLAALALFLGFAAILSENVLRAARRR